MDEKELKLKELLKEIGKIVVTYSGGIDSSYLLKVALDTLGSENVLAAVVNSELFPDYEFDMAIDLANEMGARVQQILQKFGITARNYCIKRLNNM